MYYSLFQSHIAYGSLIWSFTSQKNMRKVFFLEKICMRLLKFSDHRGYISPTFKSMKIVKLQGFIQFSVLKFLYFQFNDQFPLQVKSIFIQNESVNAYNTRSGKLFFTPHINTIHFGKESLRYNGSLTWNNFFQCISNNNFYNVGISNFFFLKDLLLENYQQYLQLIKNIYTCDMYILLSKIHQIHNLLFYSGHSFLHQCLHEKMLN